MWKSSASKRPKCHYQKRLFRMLVVLLLKSISCAFQGMSFLVNSGRGIDRRGLHTHVSSSIRGQADTSNVLVTPYAEDAVIWDVPVGIQRREPPSDLKPNYVIFLGLAEVFQDQDGIKLADLFDADDGFRHAIRVAMREDLFIPDPTRSEKVNRFLKDLGSSLHVCWEKSPTGYANLSRVFKQYGIEDLDGATFIKKLGGMAGGGPQIKDSDGFLLRQKRFGSLIDIVTAASRLKPAHSWHQDCNLPQMTVMLGFPKTSGYQGTGVFSHAIKLSHPLKDQVPGGGQVVQYDEYEGVGKDPKLPNNLPESVILRPWYGKGREIMIYDDSWHIHSAPDHIYRTSVWRFM